MLSVEMLARRIRTRLHDSDCITYEDDEILDCINCGIRFIRRLIASMRPALLLSETTGTLAAGENKIVLETRPTKIINVTAGGKALEETEMAFAIFKDYERTGKPEEFYLTRSFTSKPNKRASLRQNLWRPPPSKIFTTNKPTSPKNLLTIKKFPAISGYRLQVSGFR